MVDVAELIHQMNKVLDIFFVKFPNRLDRLAARMEQKPVAKQKAQPVKESNGLTYRELKDRVKLPGTNVTAPNIYTQDWDKEETPSERMDRLEALMLKKAKIVKKSA